MFENKIAVITGGANGIGKCIKEVFEMAEPDALQQPAGRLGNPLDIANMALYLCSDKAGFITGENICIDGGQTRLTVCHGGHGWIYQP